MALSRALRARHAQMAEEILFLQAENCALKRKLRDALVVIRRHAENAQQLREAGQ